MALTHYQAYQNAVAAGGPDPLAATGVTIFKQYDVEVEVGKDGTNAYEGRRVKFVITTSAPDRENDVVETPGIETSNFEKNPVVMWAHDYRQLPIGRCVAIERYPTKMIATVEFAPAEMNPLAEQVFRMIKGGFLKACSIGFRPLGWDYNEERGGVDFQKAEMLEFSVCPIPANAEALVAASAAGIDISVVKDWAARVLAEPAQSRPAGVAAVVIDVAKFLGGPDADPIRWNLALPKSFDVASQEFPPLSKEQDVAAKYVGCAIKELYHRQEPVMSTRMGAFLSALDEVVRHTAVDDIRNLTSGGSEEPPLYERIQLNSTRTEEFLVDGLRFLRWNNVRLTLRVEPRWYGLQVTTYAARQHADAARALLDKAFARARELNFLKGEAFSLSGEFLTRSAETFDDIFLAEKNVAAGKRLRDLVNEHGANLENRGVIMLGPPGNGKTLLGRILMSEAKATFIWCSARDFYHGGGFRGIAEAFEIARECAPSIIFVEDVDNYLDGYTTDLMKTEMDGIAQSKGVVTILTTNYPELLPKALIDRPGRFHDILRFDLPDAEARLAMLRKWMPALSGVALQETVKALHGYSGAHVREFVRFAGILAVQDGLAVADAARLALAKLAEQRDLITQVQTQGSRYRGFDVAKAVPRSVETVPAQLPVHVARGAAREALLVACATAADSPAIPAPFSRDAAGWKAFTKARDRFARKSHEPLTPEKLAEFLGDYGFEPEAAVLRDVMVTDAGEEEAELVGYQTLQALLGQAAQSVSDAAAQVAALVAAESGEAAAETPEAEAVEENVEAARLSAVVAFATQGIGTLQAVCGLACDLNAEDEYEAENPLLMAHGDGSLTVWKSGRVLSRANETKLKNAMAHMSAGSQHVQDVLDSVAQDDGDAEAAAAALRDADVLMDDAEADDGIVILREEEPVSDALVDVAPEMLAAAISDAIGKIVGAEVHAAVASARGRID